MPDFGDNINDRQERYGASCTFLLWNGKTKTVHLVAEDNITKDMVDDWASAIGATSNAVLIKTSIHSEWELIDRTVNPVYDEGGQDAVFVFQSQRNPDLVQYVTVPVYDAQFWDNGAIELEGGETDLIITRTLSILNKHDVLESDPDYVFVKAYIKAGNRKRTHETYAGGGVTWEEPSAIGDPGGEPAGVV